MIQPIPFLSQHLSKTYLYGRLSKGGVRFVRKPFINYMRIKTFEIATALEAKISYN